MRFTFKKNDFLKVLDTLSAVEPKTIMDGGGGYLFVIQGNRCQVHSRGATLMVRASFPIENVEGVDEGEGSDRFLYPTKFISEFYKLGQPENMLITMEYTEATTTLAYSTDRNHNAERKCLDPKLLSDFTSDMAEALKLNRSGDFFPVLLRKAVETCMPFMAGSGKSDKGETSDPNQLTLRIFDDSDPNWVAGNGYMYASSGTRLCYFRSPALVSQTKNDPVEPTDPPKSYRGLTLHRDHCRAFLAFLAKCGEKVVIYTTGKNYLAVDQTSDDSGAVFGWPLIEKSWQQFKYPPLSQDVHVCFVPKGLAIERLSYLRASLESDRDKIQLQYLCDDPLGPRFVLSTAEGNGKATCPPIQNIPKTNEKLASEPFDCPLNVDAFINLFATGEGNNLTVRVTHYPPTPPKRPKASWIFKTMDTFWLDIESGKAHDDDIDEKKVEASWIQCQVTRCVPNKT